MEKFFIIYEKNNRTYLLNNHFIIKELNIKLYTFINKLCLLYGTSVKAAQDSFTYLTNIKYKRGIVISLDKKIFYLSLRSMSAKDNILINYNEILEYHALNYNQTIIIFKNKTNYVIDVNYRIINRQYKQMSEYLRIYNYL